MTKFILFYLLTINLIGFIIMFIDKSRSIHKEWRVPEKNLIGLSMIGGSIGMLLGMHLFRHKTKHKKFTIGIPFILILQCLFIILYLKQ